MDATGIPSKPLSDVKSSDMPAGGVGEVLRRARLRAALDLSDVSAALKINTTYLQAIEDMDRATLPTRAYALGFVRCYASYLGLHGQAVVDQFDAGTCGPKTIRCDLSLPPAPFWLDFTLPKRAGFAIAMIGILGLATWFGARTAPMAHAVPPVPEMLRAWSQSPNLQNAPAITLPLVLQTQIEPGDG